MPSLPNFNSIHRATVGLALVLAALALPSAAAPAPPSAQPPTDAAVLERIKSQAKGALAVKLSAPKGGKAGELVWEGKDKTWYYQRGYIVTRPADIKEFPNATLDVVGLAVYRFVGSGWTHQKDLVTTNRYDGLPQPSDEELLAIVKGQPDRALTAEWPQVVGGIKRVVLAPEPPTRWHSAKSFSFFVEANYDLKWDGVRVVDCTRLWEVRVYKLPDGKFGNPVGSRKKDIAGCRS